MKKLDSCATGPEENEFLENLQKRIFGQDDAIRVIASAFGRHNSQLQDPKGPIGVFLFVGPPGTGKLATARAVAKHLFQDPSGFCYVNCNKPVPITQRDLDGAHQRFLEKIHKKEADRLNVWSEQLDKTIEKVKLLEEWLEKIQKELDEWQAAIKRREHNGEVIPAGELAKLKRLNSNHEKLSKKFLKDVEARNKEVSEFNQKSIEMARNGWQYHEKYPPENLLSVVFYDQVESDDSDFVPFLIEILDNGQVEVMRKGEPSILSFKNSLIFISLTISEEKLNKLLEDDGHMGFKATHEIASHNVIDKKIKDFVMEEANIPVRVSDRLEVAIFRKLNPESLEKILELKLAEMCASLASRGMELRIKMDETLKNHFVEAATKHSRSGAWFLERELNRSVGVGLARLLRTGQIKNKDQVLIKLEKTDGKDGKEEINFYKI